jgi:hypothetical protein
MCLPPRASFDAANQPLLDEVPKSPREHELGAVLLCPLSKGIYHCVASRRRKSVKLAAKPINAHFAERRQKTILVVMNP